MKLLGLLMAGALLVSAQTPFDKLVDHFYDDYFRFNPSAGTAVGFHQYDTSFEDYSQGNMRAYVTMLRSYIPKFEKAPASEDRDLVLMKIHSELLAVENIHYWTNNPDFYSSGATESIFSLISRQFAPPEVRLQSVIARENQIPRMLRDGRQNLKNPPRIFSEVALEQLPGIESFFANDVPKAFSDVNDAALLARFRKSNDGVLAALRSYQDYVKNTLLPESHGDFRIGTENYKRKLLYDEDVDIPLDRLLKIGYDDLHRNQRMLAEVARKIDPHKTTTQIADELGADHPKPDQLLATFRDTFASLKEFIQEHHIITIPSAVEPTLEETPPFMRALTTASMDTPGPFETKATKAYFNVTLPEKNWPRQETQEFMTAFNRGTIVSTAIHEAYPGHYVQLLWFHQLHSKVKKLTQVNTDVEGWAHYTEQMMLDEGYGNYDPKLRFGQLIDALLRDCRYIVGIEMHTGKMTYQQGIEFFMTQAYMTHAYAERETKRGTSDPTYLYYTLGKLEILKLREDYHQKVGAAFNLEQFHNDFVKQGGIPIKMIRRNMLGDNSPAL
ncbi:MAG TPA: DUF885 domain-containing protein [Bryobacteraceae bacterium]|nr:DUF885 domain-containing protein [Bryobacteraceae bacterium]